MKKVQLFSVFIIVWTITGLLMCYNDENDNNEIVNKLTWVMLIEFGLFLEFVFSNPVVRLCISFYKWIAPKALVVFDKLIVAFMFLWIQINKLIEILWNWARKEKD